VEEAAFLVAVQGIIGRVEIEDDLARCGGVAVEEEVDEQTFDGRRIVPDLVIAARPRRRVLEPVQGAFAGERGAVLAPGGELAGKGRQDWVMPQLVVIDQVLITQRDAEHPLPHHGFDGVLDLVLGPTISKAGRKSRDQANRSIGRAEQQPASVRGGVPAIKRGHDLAALDHFITEQVAVTLCRHRGAPLHRPNCLSQKSYRRFGAPMHLSAVRNPG
jgi:hypothetical protein